MSADASTSAEKQNGDAEPSTTAASNAAGNTAEGGGGGTGTEGGKGKEPEETNDEMRQRLETGRKELRVWLERKKKVDRDLASLEVSIHAFEGSYLSDALLPPTTATGATTSGASHQFGNIIKGYDSYLKAASGGGSSGALGGGSDRKRGPGKPGEEPKEGERMFSNSSTTYKKALEARQLLLHPSGIPSSSSVTPGTSSLDLLNTPSNLSSSQSSRHHTSHHRDRDRDRDDEDESDEEESLQGSGNKRRRHR